MKVSELRGQLLAFPDDAEVRIEQPTHDYLGTVLAVPIDGVSEVGVANDPKHQADAVVDEEKAERKVITIS